MSSATEVVRAILDEMFAGDYVDAVVADGWPAAMVREGFAMHRDTWNPAEIAATVAAELVDVGPAKCVDSIAHLWPTLPGAGVTPVLYSYLLGIRDIRIKPSSRGRHFAEYFAEVWRRRDDGLQLVADDWAEAAHVVVSGSDETVAAVVARMGADRVTGYGHRISIAIVEADGDERRWVDPLATDIVMWHQQGCFSARAVYLAGGDPRAFGAALGEAIARAERRLDATLDDAMLARRAQLRGLAEFRGDVFGKGLGWAELVEGRLAPLDLPFPHSVALFTEAPTAVATPLQGVAIGCAPRRFAHWTCIARDLGATRTCRPGELQNPPASWPHDGRSNVLDWVERG